jgi:hypothetical protein
VPDHDVFGRSLCDWVTHLLHQWDTSHPIEHTTRLPLGHTWIEFLYHTYPEKWNKVQASAIRQWVASIAHLQHRGVNVKVWYTKSGEARGISYEMDGVAFSGTKLGRAYTFPGLQKHRGISYQPEQDNPMIQALMSGEPCIPEEKLPLENYPPTHQQEPSTPKPEAPTIQNKKAYYQQLWQHYSQGIRMSNPIQFDDRVAQIAFEDGQTQKDIALMLAAGSPYVATLTPQQGHYYVNQTARSACGRSQQKPLLRQNKPSLEMEL